MASTGNLALGNALAGDSQPTVFDPQTVLGLMAPGLVGPDGKIDVQGYQQQRMWQGLMGLASGLLSKSGPSTQPVGFGQALGAGMQGMLEGQQGYDKNMLNGAAAAQAFANVGKLGAEQRLMQSKVNALKDVPGLYGQLYGSGAPTGIGAVSASAIGGAGTLSAGGPIDFPTARDLAQKVGFQGDSADKIAAIALAESSGNPFAKNEKGEHSYGITMINADAHGPIAREAYGNPLRAMQLAYDVSKGGTDFTPWTVFKNGQYQKYLPAASGTPGQPMQMAQATAPAPVSPPQPQTAHAPGAANAPATVSPATQQMLPQAIQMPNGLHIPRPDIAQQIADRLTAADMKVPPHIEAAAKMPIDQYMDLWKSQLDIAKAGPIAGNQAAATQPYTLQQKQFESDLAARNNALQNGMNLNPQNPAAGVVAVPGYAEVNAANKGAEAAAQEEQRRISTGMEPRSAQPGGSIIYPPGSPGAMAFRNAQMQNQKLPDGTTLNADGSVTVNGPSSNKDAFGKQIGEKTADELMANYKTARDAAVSLETTAEARKLLDSGINSGPFSSWKQSLDRVLGDRGLASNTEAFVATQARQVGQLIKQFGSGTGLSDADREYATKMAAGSTQLTEESIRKIMDINERASLSVIRRHNADAVKVPAGLSPYPLTVPLPDTSRPQAQGSANPGGVTSSGIKWSVK
jgi:hypothetical protein